MAHARDNPEECITVERSLFALPTDCFAWLSTAHFQEGYSVFDVDSVDDMQTTEIMLESHCYGCTAGNGSSCQGQTA